MKVVRVQLLGRLGNAGIEKFICKFRFARKLRFFICFSYPLHENVGNFCVEIKF